MFESWEVLKTSKTPVSIKQGLCFLKIFATFKNRHMKKQVTAKNLLLLALLLGLPDQVACFS